MYPTDPQSHPCYPGHDVDSYRAMLAGLSERWAEEDWRARRPERERQAAEATQLAARANARAKLNKPSVRLTIFWKTRTAGASYEIRRILTGLAANLGPDDQLALLEVWAQLPTTAKRWTAREIASIQQDVHQGRYANR
jgi:hypothetical protein